MDRHATPIEIKRAYRNKSLQMHPDKLNQRGQEVTEEDRANFQKMKAAYDVSTGVGSSCWWFLYSGELESFRDKDAGMTSCGSDY